MARNLPPPQFPIPPNQYDPNYFAEIIRSFSVFLGQYGAAGEERATQMTFTNLPTHNNNLETGGLFNHDGTVMITETNKPFPQGTSGTSAIGSVTVTTT